MLCPFSQIWQVIQHGHMTKLEWFANTGAGIKFQDIDTFKVPTTQLCPMTTTAHSLDIRNCWDSVERGGNLLAVRTVDSEPQSSRGFRCTHIRNQF